MATKSSAVEKKLLKLLRDKGAEKQAIEDDEGSISFTTNYEALSDSLWREALGGYVVNEHVNKDGTVTPVRTYRAPDKTCRQLLVDHLLGKPKPQSVAKDDSKTPKAPPAHERVDETLKGHLNAIAEDSHADGTSEPDSEHSDRGATDKAAACKTVSERLRILGMSKDEPEGS